MALHVALTGGIASGKTAVSDYFAQLGVDVIDADLVAREVVEPGSQGLLAIHNYFGSEVINTDGSLNRALLRSIVFEDEIERQWLNELLHPLIRNRMQQLRQSIQSAYSLSVIPLLYESNQHQDFDRVLVVDCPKEQQIKRLMARDNSDLEQAEAILASQASREQRLSIADDIIYNSTDLHSMQSQVINLHSKYLAMAHNENDRASI